MHSRVWHGSCQRAGAHCGIGCRRGIDVVRNKIKMFAQKKVTLPPGRHKVVILDEADRCPLTRRLHLSALIPLRSRCKLRAGCGCCLNFHLTEPDAQPQACIPFFPKRGDELKRTVSVHLNGCQRDFGAVSSSIHASWLCSMTTGAQQALRRTMEIYSNTTRFALACNTSSKVTSLLPSSELLSCDAVVPSNWTSMFCRR